MGFLKGGLVRKEIDILYSKISKIRRRGLFGGGT